MPTSVCCTYRRAPDQSLGEVAAYEQKTKRTINAEIIFISRKIKAC